MATINDGLSTYHLSTGTHRAYQPAKGNFFEFIVEDLGSLLKPGVEEALAEEAPVEEAPVEEATEEAVAEDAE